MNGKEASYYFSPGGGGWRIFGGNTWLSTGTEGGGSSNEKGTMEN